MSASKPPSPHGPEPRVARRRRMLLTVLVISFTSSTAFLTAGVSPNPAWLRPLIIAFQFIALGIVVFMIRGHWKRQDEFDQLK